MRLRVAAMLAFAFAAAATDARADDVRPRIVDGTLAPDKSSAVALCVGPLSVGCRAICGGTLIAPNLVLTARHCAAPAAPELDCATYHFDGPLAAPSTFWVTTAAVVSEQATFHRGARWDTPLARACGNDLALLTLEDTISAVEATTVAPLFGADAVIAAASSLLTVDGYGRTGPDAASDGARRARDTHVLCVGGRDACTTFADGSNLLGSEIAVDAVVCPGDSGSGLRDPAGHVLGPLGRSIGGTRPCGFGVYTTLSAHALLTARAARAASEAANAPVPSWVADAERAGNGVGGALSFGAPCDDDADCSSGECRSYDGGLAWSCTLPCASSCDGSCHTLPDGDFCFAEPAASAPPGCAAAGTDPHGAAPLGLALANLIGCALRRWRKA